MRSAHHLRARNAAHSAASAKSTEKSTRISRKLRDQLKASLHGIFVRGQRFGWDVLPRHFYSAIPEIHGLENSQSWRAPFSMFGVDGADIESQLSFAGGCCLPPLPERLTGAGIYERACEQNGAPGYGLIEAEFLFCFITTKRPNKIVQVGSGVSTAVIQMAAKEAGYKPTIVCIDPFPTEYLIRAARDNLIQLIPQPAQEVDIGLLTYLEAGDLLFVDSTHAVRPGSEVNRIILEVLPRLASGAFVHFHDIFLPYDHQYNVLDTLFFWEESTLLHAFLIHNRRYAIAVCLSMLHHACPEKLQSLLPNYRPAFMKDGLRATGDDPGHFPTAAYLFVR
jgi:hypothetical protein